MANGTSMNLRQSCDPVPRHSRGCRAGVLKEGRGVNGGRMNRKVVVIVSVIVLALLALGYFGVFEALVNALNRAD